ncbi:prefoldin subunit 2 [Venturia canescens]|uniref:prefoldin subunit 2 n=1 Tax=Venturia canescens TaxID=32260 RepID=UPI001C9BF305|nr:prefoldin subunit 2 [Venturia canescens]
MASEKKSGVKPLNKNGKSNENILAHFQALRVDQRMMASKLSELELEVNEHKIVIDTLKNVDPKRKCYRMIGGILCERVVEDVIPSLVTTKEQLAKIIESLHDQLEKKGVEINDFKEKNNIRIRGQDELHRADQDSKENKQNAIVVDPIEL